MNIEHPTSNIEHRTGEAGARPVRCSMFDLRRWMFVCGLLMTAAAFGQTTQPAQCYALLVGGMPGTPIYARRYQDWLNRFQAQLTKTANVPAANVIVFGGDKGATVESITGALAKFAGRIKPEDQFILVIVGHGSRSDADPTLVLNGPDLNAPTLAKALAGIRSDNQVILNFSGTGGDFVKVLSHKGRVNITATAAEEFAEPVFAEFFLRALESGRADGEGGAKDGAVTMLEAYNWATHQAALWICRQVGQEDGTWRVDGKESVEVFRKLFDGPDGPITPGGQRADGSRKLSADSDASKVDENVAIVVPPDLKPNTSQYWANRRVVNEHAQLEDSGQEAGVCALRGESGYEPVSPVKPGDHGHLSARVVLGKPQVLAGESK